MRSTILFFLLAFLLSSATLNAGQASIDRDAASKALTEWNNVCNKYTFLWGKTLCGPTLLVDPSTHWVVSNTDPGAGFEKGDGVYIGRLPEQFTPANTSITWQGREWAMILLPLPGDPFVRFALLAHESFHRIQPGLGLSASDALDPSLDTEPGRVWLRLELRALARALRSDGSAARESAVDATIFRTYRDRLCPGTEQMEAAMEKQEGLAEYTGVFVALRETGDINSREARAIEAFEDSNAFARSFGYAVGPALGLLLDRYAPEWRKRASSAPSLDSLLISALSVHFARDLERLARERAPMYGYRAVLSAEDEREQRQQAFLSRLRKEFLDGPILEFPSAPEMRRNFNPQTLVPLPPHGTYYPNGTFAANWGKLEVESGGALVSPDNRSLRIPAPVDIQARPIRGPGWVLQLAPSWTIRPSERPGNYVLSSIQQR
jgi:hypothetical protein